MFWICLRYNDDLLCLATLCLHIGPHQVSAALCSAVNTSSELVYVAHVLTSLCLVGPEM